jgi:hypothetical protein
MTVVPYLGILTHPSAFVIEFLGGIGLLFYATRLEHYREAHEAPLIILPWTVPERPKRHWFWIRLAIASGSLSLLAALSVFVWLRYAPHPGKTVVAEHKASLPGPTSIPVPQDSKRSAKPDHASRSHTTSNPNPRPPNSKDKEKASNNAIPPAPIIIPIPDRQSALQSVTGKPSDQQQIARIDGKTILAKDKSPGTLYASLLYASLRTSEVVRYRGTISHEQIDAIKGNLESTHKISVFPFSSGYSVGLSGGGTIYSEHHARESKDHLLF